MVYAAKTYYDRGLRVVGVNEDDERDIRYPATLFLNEQGMLTCYRKGAMHKEEIVYKVERMLSFLNNGGS